MPAILGGYSIYLAYVGLTPLKQVPREKTSICTVVILLAVLVVNLVAAALLTPMSAMRRGSPDRTGPTTGSTMTLPGVGSLDICKFEQAGKDIRAAATKAQETPISSSQPKAFLSESLGSYVRTKTECTSMGIGNVNGSQVGANYEIDGKSLKAKFINLAAAGAFARIGSVINVQSVKEAANGFQRTHSENGQIW